MFDRNRFFTETPKAETNHFKKPKFGRNRMFRRNSLISAELNLFWQKHCDFCRNRHVSAEIGISIIGLTLVAAQHNSGWDQGGRAVYPLSYSFALAVRARVRPCGLSGLFYILSKSALGRGTCHPGWDHEAESVRLKKTGIN